jgi:hypothetical protein
VRKVGQGGLKQLVARPMFAMKSSRGTLSHTPDTEAALSCRVTLYPLMGEVYKKSKPAERTRNW